MTKRRGPAGKAPSAGSHPKYSDSYALGKRLRESCPRESHAEWKAPKNRPDPLRLLQRSDEGRISELVPIRYGRMVRTPFTFYRGAAINMAADLAETPSTGVRVQACGDAHLLNFGAFATPERRIIFDINDLDETLPAPWEWDVKRLAASFVLACRDNGLGDGRARDAVLTCVSAYRKRMVEYKDMSPLDVWYASVDVETALTRVQDKEARRRFAKRLAAARARSIAEHDFPKLAASTGSMPRIKDRPPLIYHPTGEGVEDLLARAREGFDVYRSSLQEDRRVLLDRYEIQDIAIKVVGVGSVGTYCCVMLLMAGGRDPLFLQIKEARRSVLEPFAGKSLHENHGQRVVNGYRVMQSASDIFLGWSMGKLGRHFYVRQLKDLKLAPLVEFFGSATMLQYAEVCGWSLARAHARSGEPALIGGYLGKSDVFDEAIADFSLAYADQSERDHAVLKKAVRSGRVEADVEPD